MGRSSESLGDGTGFFCVGCDWEGKVGEVMRSGRFGFCAVFSRLDSSILCAIVNVVVRGCIQDS